MLYLLFAVLALNVSAVKVKFLIKIDKLEPSDTVHPVDVARQITGPKYYEMNIAPEASRLVQSHIEKHSLANGQSSSDSLPPIDMDCHVRWQTLVSVLNVLDDSSKEVSLGSDITSLEDIMAVYKALQICCPKYAVRLWNVVRACPQFHDMLTDTVTYLKWWMELFCDMPAPVPDHCWKNIIHFLYIPNKSRSMDITYKEFITAEFNKNQEWFDKNASPEMQNEMGSTHIGERQTAECPRD